MKKHFLNVLDHYLYAKQQPYNTNKLQGHYQALSKDITSTVKTWLDKYSDSSISYEVSWSHGKGNWAEIPWVLCTNTDITNSAQRGYYLGILFAADMNSCFMGLLQGVTDANQDDLVDFASLALEYVGSNSPYSNLKLGSIDLKATRTLGKKYQKYAIKNFEYKKDLLNTIDDQIIEDQFKILIKDYETLYANANRNLANLVPVSDHSYQASLQSHEEQFDITQLIEVKETVPGTLSIQQTKFKISKDKSRKALKLANFQCEIDPSHMTFITKNKRLYVEGHHLIPMSQQLNFNVSLDVTSNIVCLCPNCHRALHYGDKGVVKNKLQILLELRNSRLMKQGIFLSLKELQKIYLKTGLDQQYD